jgi:hypothetical protein
LIATGFADFAACLPIGAGALALARFWLAAMQCEG